MSRLTRRALDAIRWGLCWSGEEAAWTCWRSGAALLHLARRTMQDAETHRLRNLTGREFAKVRLTYGGKP